MGPLPASRDQSPDARNIFGVKAVVGQFTLIVVVGMVKNVVLDDVVVVAVGVGSVIPFVVAS
jgi:hypothetical protein